MNTEERIRSHLEATTSHLVAEDRLEEVMAEGRRRQIRARTARVLGAAAVVALFVGVLSVLDTQPSGPPVATDPTASVPPDTSSTPETPAPDTTTEATTTTPDALPEPAGVIVGGPDGITVLDREGNTLVELGDSGPYAGISWVAPDRQGGILFQHSTTPMPWEQGTVLRLAAGATEPSQVVAPPPGSNLVPVGTGVSEAGRPLFYYLADTPTGDGSVSRLTAIDLESGETRDLGTIEHGPGASVGVDAGGPVIDLVREGDCREHSFQHLTEGPIDSPLSDECFPRTTMTALSADGATMAFLPFQGTELVVRSVRTGEVLWQRQVPAGAFNLWSGEGGWAVQTPDQTVLVSASGETWSLPPAEEGMAVPYVTMDVGMDAGLGGDSAALPCRTTDADLASQDLPEPVAATRRQLARLAASCDYEGLAELAREHGTTLSFGDASDPVDFWVAEGRQGEDPLEILARVLATTPAQDTEAGYWAWPAAHLDPGDEGSWAELERIFGPETVGDLRQYEGYLGWRVGIADDGTWWFFVAGD